MFSSHISGFSTLEMSTSALAAFNLIYKKQRKRDRAAEDDDDDDEDDDDVDAHPLKSANKGKKSASKGKGSNKKPRSR